MKTTILSILVLTLISCDASTKEFIGSSWKVTGLNAQAKSVTVTNDVILTVKSATEFTLKLDKNNCFGTYEITGNNKIKLNNLSCTEMCCDSDFSMAVSSALYKVSTINLNKDKVTLSGDDVAIKFVKYDTALQGKKPMTKEVEKFTKEGTRSTSVTRDVGKFEKPIENGSSTTMTPKGDFITLYKSPCKGNCEEFTMLIYEDGSVVYTGKFNAQIQGKKMVTLDKNKTASLFADFQRSNFTSFASKYDNENIMDSQNTFLTYKGKKIHIRFKPSAPKELQTLLKKAETVALEVLKELKK